MERKQVEVKLTGKKRVRSTERKQKQKSVSKAKRRKKTNNELTYIVEYLSHTDCHKRAGAESNFVGRYDNYEDAAYVAVTRQLCDIDDDDDWKTCVLDYLEKKGFTSYSEIWDTCFYEALYERPGEFTNHRDGDYYTITKCKLSRRPRKKPVEEYLRSIGIDNIPEQS